VAHVHPLDRAELPEFEDAFQIIESVMGFVPRSMFTMGRNPALLRGFGALSFAVLGPGRIDGGLKQMIAHVASTAAGCRYCQAHTASSAARSGVETDKIASVWEFETNDLFTPAERAALALARDASVTPNATTPQHFEDLSHHFDDDDVVEIVSVISLFGWLNRWNDTMGTELEASPRSFAGEHLAQRGWDVGHHAVD
jgi:uncharacterized peroxidase-related enzyme